MHQIKKDKCQICENGFLRESTASTTVVHNGVTGNVVSIFSTCSFCGTEQANSGQLSANKAAMETFKQTIKDKPPS